jgi:hypothetical protein
MSTYIALFAGVLFQLSTTAHFIDQTKPRILTTPHELALIPLTFNVPERAMYLRPYAGLPAEAGELKHVQALLPIYAAAFFFWFTGLFLYIFSRVRRLERAYILFSAFTAAYMLFFVDYFTRRYTGNFFLSYNIIVIAPFLYLYRSVYDLSTRGFIYPVIMAIGVAAFFLLPIKIPDEENMFVKNQG